MAEVVQNSKPARRRRKSELYPEFLSVQNLNPWSGHDSASRKQMFAGNTPQMLSLLNPTRRAAVTGMEREYGKYCFQVVMPHDAQILYVFDRVFQGTGRGGLKVKGDFHEQVVIYEVMDGEKEGMVGILHMPKYKSYHKRFGFDMIYDEENLKKLYRGSHISGGTVFARPASLTPDGEYMYGREALTMFMTLPPTIEDGAMISETFANNMCTHGYEERVVSYGKEAYPLAIYDDGSGNYKCHPDIGEKVREDGRLMVLRTYDDSLGAIQMTRKRLTQTDNIFDKVIYATPGSEVVDVRVYHNNDVGQGRTPVGMEFTDQRYDNSQITFYKNLIALFEELNLEGKGTGRYPSHELRRLVTEAKLYLNSGNKAKRKLGYRRQEIDDWRVVITLKEVIRPGMGIKITDTHGGRNF